MLSSESSVERLAASCDLTSGELGNDNVETVLDIMICDGHITEYLIRMTPHI